MKSEAQKQCEMYIRPRKEIEEKIRELEGINNSIEDGTVDYVINDQEINVLKWVLSNE